MPTGTAPPKPTVGSDVLTVGFAGHLVLAPLGITFVPVLGLSWCVVALACWPQDTGLVAELAAVANEFRASVAAT